MAKQRSKRGRPGAKQVKAKPTSQKRERRREGPTQAERWEAERRARRRRALRTRVAVIVVGIALVGGVVAWQVTNRRNASRTIATLTAGSCRYDTRSDRGRVNEHGANPTFTVNPPSGGVHSASVAPSGTFSAENAPGDGEVVHALEHGGIAVSYRPGLPPDRLAALEAIADEHGEDVLLLPRSSLGVPVAATAWHRRILCDQAEPDTVGRFVDAYAGEGPENPG